MCKHSSEKKNITTILLLTTLGIILIYGPFLMKKYLYMYMDIGADTYSSYWPYYIFYSEYIKDWDFGLWSFNFGLGGNILTNSSLLFDPFNIILFLFNKESLGYGLIIITIIKIYITMYFSYKFLSSFIISDFSKIISTLSYTFSGFFIVWGQHYHFATMFTLFTLLIYLVEKWIKFRNNKILILTFSILITNTPYFTYMISLFLLIYIPIRYCYVNGFNLKKLFEFLIKTFAIFFIGLLISAIFVLPIINITLNTPRVSGGIFPSIQILPIKEYITIFSSLYSNNLLGTHYFNGFGNYYEAPHLFIGVLILLIFPVLLRDNLKNKYFIISSCIVIVFILFPSISNPIFNGFSDYTYRWNFCLVPILVLALAKAITKIEEEKIHGKIYDKSIIMAYIINALLLLLFYLYKEKIINLKENIQIIDASFIIICITLTGYLILFNINWVKKGKIIQFFILSLLLFDLFSNSYISVVKRSLIPIEQKDKIVYLDDTNLALDYLTKVDEEFYRVYKNYSKIDLNDALFQDYYGDKLYNSLNNPSIIEFNRAFDLRLKESFHYLVGFDDKKELYNLFGFKYFITSEKNDHYGYKYISQKGDKYLYLNENALPLSFAYDSYITEEEFYSLTLEERLGVISKSFVASTDSSFDNIEKKPLNIINKLNDPIVDFSKIRYESIGNLEGELPGNFQFKSTTRDSNIILPTKRLNSKPVVVKFNANSVHSTNGKIYYRTKNQEFNEINSIPFTIVPGKKDYYFEIDLLNIHEIRLDLSDTIGQYSMSNLWIFEKDVTHMKENYDKLKNNTLNIISFSENEVKGQIYRKSDGMLFFSIPYDEGWRAKINGKEVPIKKVNIGFLGIEVNKGENNIEIFYQPKLLNLGKILSLIGIVMYFILLFRRVKW